MSKLVTEEHEGPQRSGKRTKREVLVRAFPDSRIAPVPPNKQPVGRDWFAAQGAVDGRLSTSHLAFHRAGGQLSVEDAGSRNGTFVDGTRLVPGEHAPLADGSVLRVGRSIFVYRADFIGADAPSSPIGALVAPYGMRQVEEALRSLATLPVKNVLIEGETGSGKELVARAAAASKGRGAKYAAVNVAGVAAGVFESQLFGYEAGAYSGGGKGSPGVFRAHDGGAVFLDEIGELPLDLQAKLLRVLDNREVLSVGATRATSVDVLVISATNRILEQCVLEGTFRRDLHARLTQFKLELPPLRERAEDLFAIATTMMLAQQTPISLDRVEVEAVERLMLCPWPSNIRELASVLMRVCAREGGPALRLEAVEAIVGAVASGTGVALTRESVDRALAECGSEAAAARRLNVSRGKLRRFREGQG